MGPEINALRSEAGSLPATESPRRSGQKGSRSDGRAGERLVALLYAPLPSLMRLLVAIHFRRFLVRRARRFPASGGVVVVANHPATWADALVLEVAFGRKLHFLTLDSLFRPALRGWFLRLYGSLPVTKDGPGHEARNLQTFDQCRELLDRSEVVAIFPEGVSDDDRTVRAFHPGAARIAFDQVASGGPLSVVPLAIHYADRRAFRDDVVIHVGRPRALGPDDAPAASARAPWVELETARLRREVVRGLGRAARCACRLERDVHSEARRRIAWVILAAPLALAGLLLHWPPALATRIATSRVADPTHVALARVLSGLAFFPLWYVGLVFAWSRIQPIGSALALAAVIAALGALSLPWLDAVRALRAPSREVARTRTTS